MRNLTEDENRILELKYKSKRFGVMTEKEIKIAAHAILIKIHVITGWVVPVDETFLDILLDQFMKKMVESYGNVNMDEIEYAFRQFGTEVKDWGKSMNLSLIDEVMVPYLEMRRTVSKIEEQKKTKVIEAPKEEMSEQTYQDWYKSTAKDFAEGKIQLEFLPPLLADWLIQKGEIDHEQFYKKAAIMIGKKLAAEAETDAEKRKEYHEFKAMYERAVNKGEPFTGDWPAKIERLAKQISLNNYILQEMEL